MGTLYLGTKTKTCLQRLYPSVFIFRRLLYAVLVVVCINNPNILIHVYLLCNICYVVYLGVTEPNDSTVGRRVEYFNETGLQIITYHLALFPLALTVEGEEMLGWSMIACVVLVFAVNLGVMITLTIKNVKRKCFLKSLRRKALKRAEERKQRKVLSAQNLVEIKIKSFADVVNVPVEESKEEPVEESKEI